jgi:hypothetical protein
MTMSLCSFVPLVSGSRFGHYERVIASSARQAPPRSFDRCRRLLRPASVSLGVVGTAATQLVLALILDATVGSAHGFGFWSAVTAIFLAPFLALVCLPLGFRLSRFRTGLLIGAVVYVGVQLVLIVPGL